MFFICHRIFEQHNNITMCEYVISLNKFNNIMIAFMTFNSSLVPLFEGL